MFQLSRQPIRTQLSILLVVAAFFLVCVAAAGAWGLARSAAFARHSHEQNLPRQTAVRALMDAVTTRAVSARNLALATDATAREQERERVERAHEATQAAVRQLQALALNAGPDAQRLVEAVVAAEAAYGPVALQITGVAAEGDLMRAASMIIELCRPLLARLDAATHTLLKHEAAEAQRDHDSLLESTRDAILLAVLLGAVALVLLICLGLVITRGLVRSSQDALHAVERMAAGDMSLRLQAEGRSEPQRVLRSLDGMAARLREVLGAVRQASDQIATASEEVAKGSQDLSVRTEQAASSLQETAASMEEMTATVQHSSGSAREANQLASRSAEVARRSGETVEQVVRSMSDIQRSSIRIGEIIGVIDGIAFQTNILALNASVEAARAGEQGRGFAVVAAEVRNLAQRSAQAAKEIKLLIEQSGAQIAGGTRQAQEAGGTMIEVVENARRVSGIVGEITTASSEQADGVAQINVAVGQLDQMTQQNAALVEQTSAAAESLKEQARQLAAAVAVFRLEGGEDAAPHTA